MVSFFFFFAGFLGLRIEDIIVENKEVQWALDHAPPHVIEARNRRLRRALDLSYKREYLPEEIQKQQDPWKRELEPLIEQAKKLHKEEKELLG